MLIQILETIRTFIERRLVEFGETIDLALAQFDRAVFPVVDRVFGFVVEAGETLRREIAKPYWQLFLVYLIVLLIVLFV